MRLSTKKDWEQFYDSIPGTNSKKTLEMLIEYAKVSFGPLGGAYGTTRSALNRFFTMHSLRSHCDTVQEVLAPYLDERRLGASDSSLVLSPEARSPGYLIFVVRRALGQKNETLKPNGTLDNILKIIQEKNGLSEDDIHDLAGARTVPQY